MSALSILLLGQDACFAQMLIYELERAGYGVIANPSLPVSVNCALVDLDSVSPPDDLPYIAYTRNRELAEQNPNLLLRPFAVSTLLALIEQLGETAAELPRRMLSVSGSDRTARYGYVSLPLMPAEYALLDALLAADGKPVRRAELIAVLPSGKQPASNLLEVTICSLRKKLEETFGLRPIRTVRGVGWRLEKPD
ncbi:MAG: winged helix-turn-helix domain-containing protein [Clostridia bacterium]|nr:winged helix-turn-helix domain-containing protein [Clostridia bacterium]